MWYLDWEFWSAIVALLALVLSQLPPLTSLLRRGKLELKKHKCIVVHHNIGTPYVNMYVSLKNVGGKTLSIAGLQIKLTRDGTDLPLLLGSGYFADLNTQQLTMSTPFELESNTSWAHTVYFCEKWNRVQQQKFRAISSKVRDTINEKLKREPLQAGEIHAANSEQVEEIQNQFDNNFKWLPGEYKGHLDVLDSSDNLLLQDEFKFTLFETESDELRVMSSEYRYGYGIYLPNSQKQLGIVIELVL